MGNAKQDTAGKRDAGAKSLWRRLSTLFGDRGPALVSGHPVMEVNNAAVCKMDQDRPLGEYAFTVFDTELTGLSPRRDEIVSIGAVRVENLSLDPNKRFYSLVRPEKSLSKPSTLIHRITPEAVRDAPGMDEALPAFLEFSRGTLFVGHHVGLDMAFLGRACRALYGERPKNPCLDTMRLAMAWRERCFEDYHDRFNLSVSYNLSDLAREYGLPEFAAHNALSDALQTAYLFLFLAGNLRRRGVETLRDLYLAGRGWKGSI